MQAGRRRVVGVAVVALALGFSVEMAHGAFGSLSFVESEIDGVGGVDGLQAAEGIAVSRDGASVYVVGQNEDAVAAFSRDPATGTLSFIEVERDDDAGVDGIGIPHDVAVSPDGLSVYVTGARAQDNAVATFSREPNGALDFVEAEKEGQNSVDGIEAPQEVAVSPDGKHVYVTGLVDSAVVAFTRDQGNGGLTWVEAEKDGMNGVDGIRFAQGVEISPGGEHVYVAGNGDNAVATFSRDADSGELEFVEFDQDGTSGVDGLSGATDVAVSRDGANVYVSSTGDSAVATFSRDPATGALSFVEQDRDGVDGVDGLLNSYGVAVSPDGAHVYATGHNDDAVAVFARDPATGALAFVEQDRNGIDGVDGLDGPKSVEVSGDGANLYVSGRNDNALVAFAREPFTTPHVADDDPPETSIVKGPKKKTKKRKTKVTFTADEPATFDCALDGREQFKPCTSPIKLKVKRGKHSFTVQAIDTAGNTDPTPAERKWKVKKKK